jgi:uncharacterized protein YukE
LLWYAWLVVVRTVTKWRPGTLGETVTLRDYVDARLTDLARYHDVTVADIQAEMDRRLANSQRESDQRFAEAQEGIKATATALEHRFEGLNQWRQQSADRENAFATKDLLGALAARLDAIEALLDKQRGRQAVYAAAVGLIVAAVAVITLLLGHFQFK